MKHHDVCSISWVKHLIIIFSEEGENFGVGSAGAWNSTWIKDNTPNAFLYPMDGQEGRLIFPTHT